MSYKSMKRHEEARRIASDLVEFLTVITKNNQGIAINAMILVIAAIVSETSKSEEDVKAGVEAVLGTFEDVVTQLWKEKTK